MASIMLKDIPEHVHGALKVEAEANFRSLSQEALARLQRSLDMDLATRRDQAWINEALASGPAEPFSATRLATAVERGIAKAAIRP